MNISLPFGLSDSRLAPIVRDPLVWLIVGIFAIGSLTSPYFFTVQNFDTLMRSVAIIGLLSLGVTMVMLTGRIDLSVAAIMVFSVILAVVVVDAIGDLSGTRWVVRGNSFVGPSALVIAITLVASALAGFVNGVGVAWFKVSALHGSRCRRSS